MLKPSFWLSLLTAILAADLSTSTSTPTTSRKASNATCPSLLVTDENPTEEQQINEEAKRSLGGKLLQL